MLVSYSAQDIDGMQIILYKIKYKIMMYIFLYTIYSVMWQWLHLKNISLAVSSLGLVYKSSSLSFSHTSMERKIELHAQY